jgi:hypothetical protein
MAYTRWVHVGVRHCVVLQWTSAEHELCHTQHPLRRHWSLHNHQPGIAVHRWKHKQQKHVVLSVLTLTGCCLPHIHSTQHDSEHGCLGIPMMTGGRVRCRASLRYFAPSSLHNVRCASAGTTLATLSVPEFHLYSRACIYEAIASCLSL